MKCDDISIGIKMQQLFSIGKSNKLTIQLARYMIVGGLSFIVDFVLLYYFTEVLLINYLISAAISFTIGVGVNYLLSIFWVFKKRNVANRLNEFFIFTAIGAIGLLFNELFLWLFTDLLTTHYLLSKVFAAILIFLWNFFARRYILFN